MCDGFKGVKGVMIMGVCGDEKRDGCGGVRGS